MVFDRDGDPVRWGIIGCGDVCEVKSGPAFNKIEGSSLVAVMRRNFELAADFAKRHQVPRFYGNAEALIADAEVDAVYIATPPSSHKEYALMVARAGKICCIEKPMAMNYQECLEINEAFASRNIPVFVAYYRRSLPRFKQVKSWLEQELIGEVLHLQWTLRKPHSDLDRRGAKNWRTQAEIAGGGYFVDLASHGLNLFAWLLGEIIQACGVKTNQHGLYKVEDAVSGSWLFEGGATGSGSWHFGAQDAFEEVVIRGTKGKIIFSVFDESPLQLISDDETSSRTIKNPQNIQYVHIQNIIRHLRGELIHPSLGESAARTNWVMDKILGTNLII